MSEVSVELEMLAPHAESSDVSLPAPLQFTRGPVSDDGSESFPTPRLLPPAYILSPETFEPQRNLTLTGKARTCLVTIHHASANHTFDHVYPTPVVLQVR